MMPATNHAEYPAEIPGSPAPRRLHLVINHASPSGTMQSAKRLTPRPLTPREREVVELAYLSNADIALALGIAVATVKCELRNAMSKLGASNRTEAMMVTMGEASGLAA